MAEKEDTFGDEGEEKGTRDDQEYEELAAKYEAARLAREGEQPE